MAQRIEAEGLVHLVSPIGGSEHTLCGDAFDAATDNPGYEWKPTKRRKVTCPQCARIILDCRYVQVEVPA